MRDVYKHTVAIDNTYTIKRPQSDQKLNTICLLGLTFLLTQRSVKNLDLYRDLHACSTTSEANALEC